METAVSPDRYRFDRVWRPEQLPHALPGAMRVRTDPVETGAVTLCLPRDLQAEAYGYPDELFAVLHRQNLALDLPTDRAVNGGHDESR